MPAKRSVDQCQFRQTTSAQNSRCLLLQEITGVVDSNLCHVPAGACEACCESIPPSTTDPNHVVASLLYQLAESIVAARGVDGCSVTRAQELLEVATASMPKTEADENECPITEVPDYSQPSGMKPADELIPAIPAIVPIKKWAVGVTTAPRRLSTVDDCLDSVKNAGWKTPRIFSDAEVPLAERHADLPVTLRTPLVGAWPNFYLSVAELLMRDPDADAYLMIQDDVLFYNHTGLKEYLQRALWKTDQPCMASLFCPRDYTQPQHGWVDFDGEWVWGAQAFVFSRSAAQAFLMDEEVVHHRWNRKYEGTFGIDVLVGRWAHRCGVPICFPTPSLCQHIGHVSAIWSRAHIIGPRRADRFAGDLKDKPSDD